MPPFVAAVCAFGQLRPGSPVPVLTCVLCHAASCFPPQPVPVLLEEVEEAMTEEEYEAELEREAQAKAAKIASDGKEEGDILSVEEQERIKAKVASFAPWMTVDPEVRRHRRTATWFRTSDPPFVACRV